MIREMIADDWKRVAEIYEQGLEKGISTFNTQCPSYEEWDNGHCKECRYVYVSDEKVVGWIAISPTSGRCVYRGCVEVSIYIDSSYQGKGIGTQLMTKLCEETEKAGYWSLYSAIFSINKASIALHKKCGFREIGYREKIAKDRFGVWQNTTLMERRNGIGKKINLLQELGISVKEPDKEAMEKAQKQWDSVAKPLHSLGKLEDMVVQLAGIYRTSQIDISKKGVLVYCADNGVVEEGVSQSGSEVTALVAKSLADGRSNVNIMAKSMGAEVFPVDVGIKTELNYPGILQYKISQGTKNIAKEPAMTAEQCLQAIRTGIALVGKKKAEGINILAIGEMGIGNTTTSSAVASVLVQKPIADMTGRGAGLSTEGLEKKKQVIAKAIALHQPDKEEPFQVLCSLGGYDIAAMTGTCIGGMVYDIPVVLDGIISTVAALVAVRMVPECRPYLLASHVSKEPAGAYVLEALEMEAVLHADMCLGEGTGAVLLFPILEAALAEYRSAHTFHEIALEPYEKLL